MAKYGLLLPYEEIAEMAETVIQETKADIAYKKVIATVESVNEARRAIEAGADILIARGHQAMLIKKHTNIPLVELRLHAQEIGLLLKQSKNILKKECPTIGLVTFENMLGDMSCMEELFGVRLLISTFNRMEDVLGQVSSLAAQGAELFIGGDAVSGAANTLGYPALTYRSSLESLREAFREAERIAYAMEIEKKSEAQFETVLDTTFNGIIKLNAEGRITAINKLIEDLTGRSMESVLGLPVIQVFPDFDEKMIEDILEGNAENYNVSINIRDQAWMLLMAPIQYQDSITGAILSLQKLSGSRAGSRQRDMFLNGFTAKHEMSDIHTYNAGMREQVNLARRYALSDAPVLIYAEEGTEYFTFGEAIHNSSSRKNEPFVSLDIASLSEEEQMDAIFGRNSMEESREKHMWAAAVRANNGTMFLRNIEGMSMQVQCQLARTLLRTSARTDILPMDNLNVRLIASSKVNLADMVNKGTFHVELFYLLQGLVLEIPPLRRRPEDLGFYFETFFAEYSKQYAKYLILTQGAKKTILGFSWKGNMVQLKSFCERLVLMADHRSVDEVQIQRLYDQLYPRLLEDDNGRTRMVVYNAPEADELRGLMEKFHGNRTLIANELGISTTTLWRRMKKYGIEAKYQ
ncbi:MAG: PrpR N-terminal domain-containing protein [Clostridiales bacterium]|nr:PrpR N-terminal domain-containing protein [Clostridiales bacterium]